MPGARNLRMVVVRLMPDQQRSQARDLQGPQVVVDADPGRVGDFGQRRIGEPAGARKFADDQREIDEQHARRGQPEADRVQHREGHIAHAKLQRHDEVHEPDHERHGHEKDHDGAVRREDLIVVLGRQIALGGDLRPGRVGCASCMASEKPRTSITSAKPMYITPMRL